MGPRECYRMLLDKVFEAVLKNPAERIAVGQGAPSSRPRMENVGDYIANKGGYGGGYPGKWRARCKKGFHGKGKSKGRGKGYRSEGCATGDLDGRSRHQCDQAEKRGAVPIFRGRARSQNQFFRRSRSGSQDRSEGRNRHCAKHRSRTRSWHRLRSPRRSRSNRSLSAGTSTQSLVSSLSNITVVAKRVPENRNSTPGVKTRGKRAGRGRNRR